jgi:hypothetical protein
VLSVPAAAMSNCSASPGPRLRAGFTGRPSLHPTRPAPESSYPQSDCFGSSTAQTLDRLLVRTPIVATALSPGEGRPPRRAQPGTGRHPPAAHCPRGGCAATKDGCGQSASNTSRSHCDCLRLPAGKQAADLSGRLRPSPLLSDAPCPSPQGCCTLDSTGYTHFS